jgi:hypothetical protein
VYEEDGILRVRRVGDKKPAAKPPPQAKNEDEEKGESDGEKRANDQLAAETVGQAKEKDKTLKYEKVTSSEAKDDGGGVDPNIDHRAFLEIKANLQEEDGIVGDEDNNHEEKGDEYQDYQDYDDDVYVDQPSNSKDYDDIDGHHIHQ